MSNQSLRLKLAKMLLKFATVETDKGILNFEGELVEGIEVYIEDAEGNMIPAEDGEYIYEKKKIVVKDGKIESIAEIVEEEKVEETMEENVVEPATGDAIMALANEIEILKAELANVKGEIEGLKMAIEYIKKSATDVNIEENFSEQKATKPIWDKFTK